MSVFTLQPNNHLAVAYGAPLTGPARYYVESEYPITILAVDDANLTAWRAGHPYNPLGGAAEVQAFRQEIANEKFSDPFAHFTLLTALGVRRWHLVMVNFHPTRATAVYYNVQS